MMLMAAIRLLRPAVAAVAAHLITCGAVDTIPPFRLSSRSHASRNVSIDVCFIETMLKNKSLSEFASRPPLTLASTEMRFRANSDFEALQRRLLWPRSHKLLLSPRTSSVHTAWPLDWWDVVFVLFAVASDVRRNVDCVSLHFHCK